MAATTRLFTFNKEVTKGEAHRGLDKRGDASGMNAAITAVVRTALKAEAVVVPEV